MTSSYQILFSADLLNDYYKNGLCTDFSIVPSSSTMTLIRNFQLVYKTPGNRMVLLTRLLRSSSPADDGKPFVPVDPTAKFVFYLSLNKPELISFSNINLDQLGTKRFYFTNLNKNKHLSFVNLSAVTDSYKGVATYQPGDLVDDGTGQIFECMKTTSGINTSHDDVWFARGDAQYVSANDMIEPVSSVFNYQAAAAAKDFVITVFGLDTQTDTYTREMFSVTQSYVAAVQNLQLDLSVVPDGKYRIRINSEELLVYKADEMLYNGYFGVIEIFSHLPNGSDFAFLDGSGKPFEQAYHIRFANRLATWKYVTPRHGVTAVTHPAGKYSFTRFPVPPADAEYFQSNLPVPLAQFPEEFRLQLSPQVSSGPPRAPGPDITMPGVLTRPAPGNDFFCNIYLNY